MEVQKGETIKLRVEIVVEVKSDKYTGSDEMLDEIAYESDYDLPSTENVEVVGTEMRSVSLI